MSISAHFQQVCSRREGRRTKTRVGRSLTCCYEESIEVIGRRLTPSAQHRHCIRSTEAFTSAAEYTIRPDVDDLKLLQIGV